MLYNVENSIRKIISNISLSELLSLGIDVS
jgi:hypothetical protein